MKNNRHLKSIVFFSLIIAQAPIMSMKAPDLKYLKKNDGRKTPPPTTTTTTPVPATTNPLEKSQIIHVIPETSGLGLFRSAKNLIWAEEENFYADLENGNYNPKNASHPRILDKTINAFTDKNNDEKLTQTIEICRSKYGEIITINHPTGIKSHNYLVQQHKAREASLTLQLQDNDKKNKDAVNALLVATKKSMDEQITNLSKQISEQKTQQIEDLKQEGNEIRRIKHARLSLRKLTRQNNQVTNDGYCSDSDDTKDSNKAIEQYNDQHILRKLKLDTPLSETDQKRAQILEKLIALNTELQAIQPLTH